MLKKSTALRLLFTLLLVVLIGQFVTQLRTPNWLQTDLASLLPPTQHWTALQQQADQQQQQQFNQQVIAFVGANDPALAFQLADQVTARWQTSGLFQQIFSKTQPDLTALRQQLQQLKLATLPLPVRHELLTQPQRYFQHYAQQLINPFQQENLLSLEQDWLGFGRFVLSQSPLANRLQWQPSNGMLSIQDGDKTWVLLRGELVTSDMLNPQQSLTALLADNQHWVEQQQGEWLAMGAALFANAAKQQAENESKLMSIVGVSLTLFLLLGLFRRLAVLWLFLPIGIGMLGGISATVLLWGHIHILTLVVGTSLVGVLIDFPLHWLAGSLFEPQWQGKQAMRKLRLSFLISLLVTLLGYVLLGFTSLPILQQTALFSAVALLLAMATTLLYLPPLFRRYRPDKRSIFFEFWQLALPCWLKPVLGGMALLFVIIGIAKSQWQDDLRQWVNLPPELVSQAKQISELTGIDLGSQYFLVVAESDEQLLQLSQQLSHPLLALQQKGVLTHFQALNQWIMSEAEQRTFIAQLQQRLQPQDFAIFTELGMDISPFLAASKQLAHQPTLPLAQALNSEMGQSWRSLYLGNMMGKIVGMVKVMGVKDASQLQALADQSQFFWQDKPSALNQAFQQSRDQAAWLKLLSLVLAGLLLWRLFGIGSALKMLCIPMIAMAVTVAVFGWLGWTISLFAMFGLLLVSAISIDYAAYMQTAPERLAAKRATVGLAALTTLISFLLLGLSHTPAVASFGWSVSIGIIVSLLTLFKLLR